MNIPTFYAHSFAIGEAPHETQILGCILESDGKTAIPMVRLLVPVTALAQLKELIDKKFETKEESA